MSTIRFQELVKAAGKPELVALWGDPKQDRHFMKAVKQNRVLTVIQEPASKKKDFGQIGFHRQPHAAFLVFPKPLPEERLKVIGIQYDLVDQPRPSDTISPKELERERRSRSGRQKRSRPEAETFNVLVRQAAVIERTIEVKVRSKGEARSRALQDIKGQGFDLSKAVITTEVRAVD